MNKKIFFVLILILIIPIVNGLNFYMGDKSTSSLSAFPLGYSSGYNYLAFGFTANNTFLLNTIEVLQYQKLGTPVWNFTIQIQKADLSLQPIGNILGTTSNLLSTNFYSTGYYNVTLLNNVTMYTGERYAIVINKSKGANSTSNYLQFRTITIGVNALYRAVPFWTTQDLTASFNYALYGYEKINYFNITANIDEYEALINNVLYTTTNGTIITNISILEGNKNIVLSAEGYYDIILNNYDIQSPYTAFFIEEEITTGGTIEIERDFLFYLLIFIILGVIGYLSINDKHLLQPILSMFGLTIVATMPHTNNIINTTFIFLFIIIGIIAIFQIIIKVKAEK